ncbi:hypothetical protein M8C21_022363, partial [Ambrosia artemisiifolia]
ILKRDGGLQPTQRRSVEEHVATFLHILKPDAATVKKKKISNCNEMLELFARDRASGEQAETTKERNARLQKTDNINIESVLEVDDFSAASDVMLESQNIIDDDIQVVYPSSSQLEQSSSAKKCKSRKRKVEQQDEDLTFVIMNSAGSVANAIIDGNKIILESNNILERVYHREYTDEEIYNELEPIGLETHELPLAFNYLSENQAKARSLFTCPPQIRLTMLKGMIGLNN